MKFLATLLCLLCFGSAYATQVKVTVGSSLRSSSDYKTATEVGQVAEGKILEVVAIYGDYILITDGKTEGWASQNDQNGNPLISKNDKGELVVGGQGVSIWNQPKRDAKGNLIPDRKIIGSIAGGAIVTLKDTRVTWYQVKSGDLIAWIYAGNVDVVAPPAATNK